MKIFLTVVLVFISYFILVLSITITRGWIEKTIIKKKIKEVVKKDWLPNKKYIYVGYDSNHPLCKFLKDELIGKYKNYIVWDERSYSSAEHKKYVYSVYKRREITKSNRLSAFGKGYGIDNYTDNEGVYGPSNCVIGAYNNDLDFTKGENLFALQFFSGEVNPLSVPLEGRGLYLNPGKKITETEAKKKIEKIVEDAIKQWH